LEARVDAGASNSLPLECSDLVFQEGGQLIEEAGSGGDLRVTAEMEGEAGMGRLPLLNTYSPTSGGLSGYSDWVIQSANEIYPIVGI
jgi:hypothetical protein